MKAALFTLLVIAGMSAPAWAETIPCPNLGYELIKQEGYMRDGPPGTIYPDKRDTITYNGAECNYESGIRLYLTWVSYYDHAKLNYPDCRWNEFLGGDPEKYYEVRKKSRKASISSRTHLASVHLDLSRKEFREANRKKWMDAAEALLDKYKLRGLPCDQTTGEWGEYPGESAVSVSTPASRAAAAPDTNLPAAGSNRTTGAPTYQKEKTDNIDAQIDDILNRLKNQ
ncbi:MAG: hypothetical protein KC897_11935 [Candidatus Omnitrophica bacterium]|nr:hypothetical protein [Candidatus Omnitrophota bacterium]MCB9720223.1 hypothetical protein [Candidatus Omnitrophota bacterium]